MKKLLFLITFLFFSLFFFSSFSSNQALAISCSSTSPCPSASCNGCFRTSYSCVSGTCVASSVSSSLCNSNCTGTWCNSATNTLCGQTCNSSGACVNNSTTCTSTSCGGTISTPTPTPLSGGSCSPIGSERCANLSTAQTCTASGWGTSTTCPSGYYCQIVGNNPTSVSCIKGCQERGYSCIDQDSCTKQFGYVLSSTYYCSNSATICCQIPNAKWGCVSGACQQVTSTYTGTTYSESTCGGTCAPPPPSSTGYDCKDSGCVPHSGSGTAQYSDESACSKDCITELFPGCPICTSPAYYDPYTGKCATRSGRDDIIYSSPTYKTCDASINQICSPGYGCNAKIPASFTSGSLPCGADGQSCYTAFGNISIDTASLVKKFFGIVLSISGGIAVLLIILAGYRMVASQGNPEKIKEAQEHLTAAIIGLLFVIFSFAILKFIGIDVLGIFP